MLDLLFTSPLSFVVIFGGIIIAIGIHEAAHCYMADYLGDPTPRSLGRLTLNPLAHLDPVGTLVILVTGMFGWGKPSPFDPYNLRNPQRDTALIALAGPVSNLLLALGLSLIARLGLPQFLLSIFYFLISLNINLAIFNLIPIAPLDGSKIFLKNQSNQYSLLLLLLLLFPIFGGHSIASLLVSPVSSFIIHILIP
ncbi:MAG: Peptidase M50 [Candidatus Amesbacteria bacterium GW2011_GWA2_47_11b]|uniref:Peptidase M50 n=1 Tax=Candidatus Amesbacteria bacterium GW2011_GWA2_47_11b TaxID=1618358 RepID=A0A0G1TRE2_9BACT|nr:MAG: Peptidase M50 [Candidatus Amesbacteria bacterium GW2011_GWA2_47_11b]